MLRGVRMGTEHRGSCEREPVDELRKGVGLPRKSSGCLTVHMMTLRGALHLGLLLYQGPAIATRKGRTGPAQLQGPRLQEVETHQRRHDPDQRATLVENTAQEDYISPAGQWDRVTSGTPSRALTT